MKNDNQQLASVDEAKGQGTLAPATCSAADEYLKTHQSAKWCPIYGFIYLMRYAPVLTTTAIILSAIIGGCLAHHAASR
jgi:hypothetical protein